MGECGCAQENVTLVMPGPDDTRYGIEIYSGCHDCGTGPSLGIYQVTNDEYDLLREAAPPDWVAYTEGVKFHGEPIITPEALVESLKENMADYLVSPERLKPSHLHRTLEDAVWRTDSAPHSSTGGTAT